ncbi:MAG: hypothetical protein U9N83_12325, partial [Thermodesulfobacteriota bacterium]|nr:hypothetical protein [Thermodesulfobacteriota bacterium]
GIQKPLNLLDSGLAVIPDPDPGRNDKKGCFSTFYEIIKVKESLRSGFYTNWKYSLTLGLQLGEHFRSL